MKKQRPSKKSATITERVSSIELEFAKHHAICGERYKNQELVLERIEKATIKNSQAIEKLFGISNKGLGAIKVLILVGTIIAGAFSFFKFKDFI
jgi:hypothetical protein